MIVLGIDTSCDDTGVGLVEDGLGILSNVIASQHSFHERFGGIVPSVASRQHARVFNPVLAEAIETADVDLGKVDAIAVTSDQGLALSLAVGVAGAKSLAMTLGVPLIGIHHVEGHIYSVLMAHAGSLDFPFLCLTAAGGHTMLIVAHSFGEYELLGFTRDDSAGEAYDKVARRLGLPFPGGPVIDRLAASGDPTRYRFPRPMLAPGNLEFSFSGLKTAVNKVIDNLETSGVPWSVEDLAASFQAAVIDVLVAKALDAAKLTGLDKLAVAGGVAANSLLRSRLAEAEAAGVAPRVPAPARALHRQRRDDRRRGLPAPGPRRILRPVP